MLINNIEFDMDDNHAILKLNEIELSYIAGLVDGEGCIGIHKNNQYYVYCFQMQMSDESIIQWLDIKTGMIGSRSYTESKTVKNKDLFSIRIYGKPCILFLSLIFPYLRIKKKQAEIVIEYGLLMRTCGGNKKSKEQIYSTEELKRLEELRNKITALNKRGQ